MLRGFIMREIRYVSEKDRKFWYSLDKHLPEDGFTEKIERHMGYVLSENGVPKGILRYNLFWDSIPFCTMLFIEHSVQKTGCGRELALYWERDMKAKGHGMVMVSTQVDEEAQHFYRKLGYKDAGGIVIDIPGYSQPMEMFMVKKI